jgi:hypothetical protein
MYTFPKPLPFLMSTTTNLGGNEMNHKTVKLLRGYEVDIDEKLAPLIPLLGSAASTRASAVRSASPVKPGSCFRALAT